jgi:tetratricopeptide (TPR) repeat protein
VQDEIAGAIAQALQIKLQGGEISRHEGGTQSLEAFDLYLRAGWATDQNTEASINKAGEYLEQAIKLDPSYGRAWLRLAGNFSLKADSAMLTPTDGYERARRLALHALQVSPGLAAEVHSWLQYFHIVLDWDWAAAEREGHLALAIDPTNPEVLSSIGILSRTLGRWDEAERNLRAVLVRDPLNPYSIWNLATAYYQEGRYAEAEALYRRILDVSPSFTWARNYLAKTLVALRKPEAALKVLEGEADEGSRLVILPVALRVAGRKAEADEALQAQISYWAETGAYIVAMTYAHRGDNDLAMQWLDRAYRQKDPMLFELVGEPLLNNITDDPRFNAFLRKMKLPEWPRG